MKYIFFFLIGIFAFSNQLFASSFTNLDDLCIDALNGANIYPTTTSSSGIKTQKSIILPHIFKRITTAQNFVKYDDTLYMNANTFTDEYKYLGSYLVKYDCSEPKSKLIRLGGLKRGALLNELGFIGDVNEYGVISVHAGMGASTNVYWIYDFETKKTFPISYKKMPWYKEVAPAFVGIKANTFDGNCLTLEVNPFVINPSGAYSYAYGFDQEYCIR